MQVMEELQAARTAVLYGCHHGTLWSNFMRQQQKCNKIVDSPLNLAPITNPAISDRDTKMRKAGAGKVQQGKGKKTFVRIGGIPNSIQHAPSTSFTTFGKDSGVVRFDK